MAKLYGQTFVSIHATTPITFRLDSINSSFEEEGTDFVSEKPLPIDMRFNDGHRLAIVSYSLLMILSAIGNISVLYATVR